MQILFLAQYGLLPRSRLPFAQHTPLAHEARFSAVFYYWNQHAQRHRGRQIRGLFFHTLFGSIRRHGVNPFDDSKYLFTRLPGAKITQIRVRVCPREKWGELINYEDLTYEATRRESSNKWRPRVN